MCSRPDKYILLFLSQGLICCSTDFISLWRNSNTKKRMLKNNIQLKDVGLLILRVSLGLSMLLGHGLLKWVKLIEGGEIHFADPFGLGVTVSLILAVFAEVFCSALLVFGLLTRLALIPLRSEERRVGKV